MSGHRSVSGSVAGRSPLDRKSSVNSTSSAGLGRQASYSAGTAAKYNLPPPAHAASPAAVSAPPPYTAGSTGLASTSGSIKKAPPPPPPMKRAASAAPQPEICVALFDFAPQVSTAGGPGLYRSSLNRLPPPFRLMEILALKPATGSRLSSEVIPKMIGGPVD